MLKRVYDGHSIALRTNLLLVHILGTSQVFPIDWPPNDAASKRVIFELVPGTDRFQMNSVQLLQGLFYLSMLGWRKDGGQSWKSLTVGQVLDVTGGANFVARGSFHPHLQFAYDGALFCLHSTATKIVHLAGNAHQTVHAVPDYIRGTQMGAQHRYLGVSVSLVGGKRRGVTEAAATRRRMDGRGCALYGINKSTGQASRFNLSAFGSDFYDVLACPATPPIVGRREEAMAARLREVNVEFTCMEPTGLHAQGDAERARDIGRCRSRLRCRMAPPRALADREQRIVGMKLLVCGPPDRYSRFAGRHQLAVQIAGHRLPRIRDTRAIKPSLSGYRLSAIGYRLSASVEASKRSNALAALRNSKRHTAIAR
jgi:hypothetical protein